MKVNEIRGLMQSDKMQQAFTEIEEQLKLHKESPYLWILRGDVIQLFPTEDGPPLEEARRSYLTALKLNPNDLEAIESLAHFYDCHKDQSAEAKKYAAAYIEQATKKLEAMERILNGQ